MEIRNIEDFKLGWFIGNFEPSIFKTKDFEICLKYFKTGDIEPAHFQRLATEITVIINGKARIGDMYVNSGDLIEIKPLEIADFEALTDVSLIAVKFPSIPTDKVIAG